MAVEHKGDTHFFTSEMIRACMKKTVGVSLNEVVQVAVVVVVAVVALVAMVAVVAVVAIVTVVAAVVMVVIGARMVYC